MSSHGATARLQDAQDSIALLFPGASLKRVGHGWRAPDARGFIVAPSIRYPRLLIARQPRRAPATALRCYGGRLTAKAQWGYRGLSMLLAATGGRTLGPAYAIVAPDAARHHGIDDHLSEVLGEPVSVAFQLSPPRANRKPVLQVLAAGRRTPLAFVKVGTTPLTRTLANNEAAALNRLVASENRTITAPTVMDLSEYAGASVLTMSPLPTWEAGRLPNTEEVATAAAAVADLGPRIVGRLVDAALWQRLNVDLELLTESPSYPRLRAAVDGLESEYGAMQIETGGGHGDWSPWNMWQTRSNLLIWDWERFATGVPVGADLIHYRIQQLFMGQPNLRAVAASVVDEAPVLLTSCVSDPALAKVVALVHLLTLAVRYELDGQTAAGNRLGDIQSWLLPVLEANLGLDQQGVQR